MSIEETFETQHQRLRDENASLRVEVEHTRERAAGLASECAGLANDLARVTEDAAQECGRLRALLADARDLLVKSEARGVVLTRERNALLAVIKRHEWTARTWNGRAGCPECEGVPEKGHKMGCSLRAAVEACK